MGHLTRVQAVIDFIEDHLREPLSMQQLARVGGFSVWYFQRIFRGVAGETVANYVRLRRLSSALSELRSTSRRILDVALDYQFEEPASFTRAVRTAFGLPPSALRRPRAGNLTPLGKRKITLDYLDHLYAGISIAPKFVTLPALRVVGISTPCISILSDESNSLAVVPALRREFYARLKEVSGCVNPGVFLGVFMPLPDADRKHPYEWRYMACAQIQEAVPIPHGMESETLPGGHYAVFAHRGQERRIEHTYNYIYGAWLPRSRETLREAPEMELYAGRFEAGAEHLQADLYIPVK
jgi:AraC family transcriptional regulator